MVATDTFDFKIRDKLRETCEDKSNIVHLSNNRLFDNLKLDKDWKSERVTTLMFLDMIAFTSMGDQDMAIEGLHASEEFLDEVQVMLAMVNYNTRMKTILPLLIQIWRLGFITTKHLLDHEEPIDNEANPCRTIISGTRFLTQHFVNAYLHASFQDKVDFLESFSKFLNDICLDKNESLKHYSS